MLTTYATLGFDTTNATSGFAYSTNITTPSLALTKLGPNTLTLGGDNTFSGGVTVNAGTLQLGNASALGSGGLTVNSGATVDLNGYSATISPPLDGYTASFLVGGGYLSGPAGSLITDNSSGYSTTTLTVTPSGTSTYAGSINDGDTQHIALTMNGTGIQVLSGSNNYTGGTTVTSGILEATNPGDLPGSGPINIVGDDGPAASVLAVCVGGSGFTSAQVDTLWQNATFTKTTDPDTGWPYYGAVGLDTTNGSFTYSTNITGANLGLAKLGPNTLTLTGANTYGGTTTVYAGTLQVPNAGALPYYSGAPAGYTKIIVDSGSTLAINVGGSSDWTAAQIASLLTPGSASFNGGAWASIPRMARLPMPATSASRR